ncbi:unnamed protein product [Cylindrotheca closterium]|uniref:PDZ domain-containing protein n=1 Tax=Cylindrotheca closterium TaxID=2856 RepID=A0AAD2FZW1_9STRA|nr:unnamed protein product [Cylindrotheca closterium]
MQQRSSISTFLLAWLPLGCSLLNAAPITRQSISLFVALGDYSVNLEKPLGIILEERGTENSGVQVKEIVKGGAAESTRMVPGDVLLQVNEIDVTTYDFDSVMDLLISTDGSIDLTLGDGLGQMDMPKNVLNFLTSTEDAFFVDAVVREAVRECRQRSRKLGDLLQVEVIIGAGVRDSRGQVRFFAIFSTDGVSTYSCNMSATGVRQNDESIRIVALSCAKDEGLGQTLELIRED